MLKIPAIAAVVGVIACSALAQAQSTQSTTRSIQPLPIPNSANRDRYDGPLSKQPGRPPVGSEGTTSGSTAPAGVVRPPPMQTPQMNPGLPR
jgi:hypothetical protein